LAITPAAGRAVQARGITVRLAAGGAAATAAVAQHVLGQARHQGREQEKAALPRMILAAKS